MAQIVKADVLVADAEPVARRGLIELINANPRLRICGEAENSQAARELCARCKPQVLVFDPTMSAGFSLLKDLSRWSRGTRVVVFTALRDALSVQRAFQSGAFGYIARRDPVSALLEAVEGAVAGERHIGPDIQHLLLENLACGAVNVSTDSEAILSVRETEVFRLIGHGRATREIATDLHLSVKTVETHRQRIKEKLRLPSGVELQRRAVLSQSRLAV